MISTRVLVIGLVVFFLFCCFRRKRPVHALFTCGFGLGLAAVIFAAIALYTSAREREHRRALVMQNLREDTAYQAETGSRHFGRHGERIARRVFNRFGNSENYVEEEESRPSRADSLVPATIQIKLQPAWIETTGIELDQLANGLAGAIEFIRETTVDGNGEGKVNIVELSELRMGDPDADSPLRLGDVARPIREQSPAGRDSRDTTLEIKVERGAGAAGAFSSDQLAETLARVNELIAGLTHVNVTQFGDRLVVNFTEDAGDAASSAEEQVDETIVAGATTGDETPKDDNAPAAVAADVPASSAENPSDGETATLSTSTTAVLSATDMISATRPDWINSKDGFIPEKNVYRMIGTSAAFENKDDAAGEWVVDDILYSQTLKYAIECLNIDAHDARRMPIMALYRHPDGRNRVVKDKWVGPAHVESETVTEVLADNDTRYYQLYALCEFDHQTRRELTELWQDTKIEQQLWYAGTGAGLIFALLATLLGYLTLDNKTRGYYSGRLKLAAGAVGTAAVAAAVMVFMAI